MSEENNEKKWSEEEIQSELEKLKKIETTVREKTEKLEKQEAALRKKLKLPEKTDTFSKLTDLITQAYNLYVSEKGSDQDINDFISKILEARKMVSADNL